MTGAIGAAAHAQPPVAAYGCGNETVRITEDHLDYIPDTSSGLPADERDELETALERAHARDGETILDLAFSPDCNGFVLLTTGRWIVRNIGKGDPRTDATEFVDKGGIPRTHFMRDFSGEDFDPRNQIAAYALDPFNWQSLKNYAIALQPSEKLAGDGKEARAIAQAPGNDMYYYDIEGGDIYLDLIRAFRHVFDERGGEAMATIAFVPREDRPSGWAFVTESGYYHVRGVGKHPFPGGFTRDADGEAIESHLFGAIEALSDDGADIVDITVAPDSAGAPDWMIADADGCFYSNNFHGRYGLSEMSDDEANARIEDPQEMFFQVSEEYHRGSWAEKRAACPVLGSARETQADLSDLIDRPLPGESDRERQVREAFDARKSKDVRDALKDRNRDSIDLPDEVSPDPARTPRDILEERMARDGDNGSKDED